MAGDVLKAGGPDKDQVKVGMPVVGVDGKPIGKVKEVGHRDFLVDRPLAHDVYVPFSFVLATENQWERIRGGPRMGPAEVVLTIDAAHVDTQGWPHA